VRFFDGTVERRTVQITGGQVVHLEFKRNTESGDDIPELVVQSGHAGVIHSVAFSSDGKHLVSTGSEGAILWDVDTGIQLRTYRFGGRGFMGVTNVALSPGGKMVACGTGGSSGVGIFETATGRMILHVPTANAAVAFTPDGRQVAVGGSMLGRSPRGVELWDIAEKNVVRTMTMSPSGNLAHLAISSDGKTLVTGGLAFRNLREGTGQYGELIVWDLSTGEKIHELEGHTSGITSVSIQPNGSKVVTTSLLSDKAFVWDVISGKKLRVLSNPSLFGALFGAKPPMISATFSGNGKHALGICGTELLVWDVNSGAISRRIETPGTLASTIASSSNGELIAIGSSLGDILLFNVGTGKKLRSFQSAVSRVPAVSVHPKTGEILVGTSWQGTSIWDVVGGRQARSLNTGPNTNFAIFSPDGDKVLTGTGFDAILWSVETGEQLVVLGDHDASVERAAFSPDGGTVAVGADESVHVWSLGRGREISRFRVHEYGIDSLEFSPDGRQLLTVDDDGVILRDVPAGKEVRRFTAHEDSGVLHAAFHQNGNQIVTSHHDGLVFWDRSTGRKIRSLETDSGVKVFAVEPEGRKVLLATFDNIVELWDLRSESRIRTFTGHSSYIESVSFGHDNRHVLSSSSDGTVRIWDVRTGDEAGTLLNIGTEHFEPSRQGDWLFATPRGLFDGSAGGREKVGYRIGGGLNVVPVDRFFQDFYYPGLLSAIWRGERPTPQVALGKSLPPTIKIVTPTKGGTANSSRVTIEVDVMDQGGGVKGPWIKQNGARVLAQGTTERTARSVRRKFSISLIEGENRIEIHAASADGSWESEPAVLTLRYAEPLDKPELHLLAVGINDYQQKEMRLKYATADARAMAALFQQRGPELYKRAHAHLLENESATRSGILQGIRDVGQIARKQDTVVVFLAGHGTVADSRYYFLPCDFERSSNPLEEDARSQGLPASDIGAALASVPALKRMLLLDTCQSGGTVAVARTARNPFALRRRHRTTGALRGCVQHRRDGNQRESGRGTGVGAWCVDLQSACRSASG